MASTPVLTLFDLHSTDGKCFSPSVWRVRVALNAKKIPYKTVFLEFPDIEPTLSSFGIPPNESGKSYTVPTILHHETNHYVMDSQKILAFLENLQPTPSLQLDNPQVAKLAALSRGSIGPLALAWVMPMEMHILTPRSQDHKRADIESQTGQPFAMPTADELEAAWQRAQPHIRELAAAMKPTTGPFLVGEQFSWGDCLFAGFYATLRAVDPVLLEKLLGEDHVFRVIWDSCQPYVERAD